MLRAYAGLVACARVRACVLVPFRVFQEPVRVMANGLLLGACSCFSDTLRGGCADAVVSGRQQVARQSSSRPNDDDCGHRVRSRSIHGRTVCGPATRRRPAHPLTRRCLREDYRKLIPVRPSSSCGLQAVVECCKRQAPAVSRCKYRQLTSWTASPERSDHSETSGHPLCTIRSTCRSRMR
jgi:hypothetical protein